VPPAPCSSAAAFALLALGLARAAAAEPSFPAPDPPAIEVPDAGVPRVPRAGTAGLTEWTLHKTADGAHPNGDEQTFVWRMNRARRDPAAEGVFLATVDDAQVQSALGYFDVDLGELEAEFAALASEPPAAFDARLYEAARVHSLDLIARDAQDHDGQFAEVASAGFHITDARGSVFSYCDSALQGHAAFNVDWGPGDASGMQPGRGHRAAIMGDYANVGIAALPESDPKTSVGPLVVTGNYASAATNWPDHYNRFVVGTVWQDLDGNGRYDPGEGIDGVTVVPSPGTFFAVTSAGGGYAFPMLAAGPVDVRFSGGGVAPRATRVQIGAQSAQVDYEVPEPAGTALALAAAGALGALRVKSSR
jgi:hypothetical protein